jgi:O-methyltransferase/methyltransferase family protein
MAQLTTIEPTIPAQLTAHQLPPPAVMMQLVTGYWISQAVGVTARLGVADELANGARSSAELAAAVGADASALYRVLRTLSSIGVFAEVSPGRFGLTPLGETLRSGVPGSMRDFAVAETAYGHWQPWGRMIDSVRTGRSSARETLGIELWEWYSQNPDEAEYFSAAMGNLSEVASSEVVRVYDFSKASKIVDVGGAHGVLLAAALKSNPSAGGVLFDLPHVIATARDGVRANGIADRVELVGGDFLREVPAGDLHLLKQILHDWDDEHAVQILANCQKTLPPGAPLLLVEMLIPEDNSPSPAQPMDLNMLVMLSGRERTTKEYADLLDATGFRLEQVIPTHTPFYVIEAIRK